LFFFLFISGRVVVVLTIFNFDLPDGPAIRFAVWFSVNFICSLVNFYISW
jgi:hypothetical protein